MRNLIVNECGDKCPFIHTQYGEDDYEYYEFCVLAEFNNLPENAICGAKPEWCPLTNMPITITFENYSKELQNKIDFVQMQIIELEEIGKLVEDHEFMSIANNNKLESLYKELEDLKNSNVLTKN